MTKKRKKLPKGKAKYEQAIQAHLAASKAAAMTTTKEPKRVKERPYGVKDVGRFANRMGRA